MKKKLLKDIGWFKAGSIVDMRCGYFIVRHRMSGHSVSTWIVGGTGGTAMTLAEKWASSDWFEEAEDDCHG